MLPSPAEKAYDEFANLAYSDELLDVKTAHLIKMATAMSMGCYP